MIRTAKAQWEGSGKEGHGNLTTQSTVLNHTQYSFGSRFESGIGTNPEELIAAAHAGCYSMKLSFILGEAGFTPELLETECQIKFADGKIVNSHLILKAKVTGISAEKFEECVQNAKVNCPISKSLNTEITLEAELTIDKGQLSMS